ncbi:chaperonin 10-like protein [Paraphoma chrysanthemicola]|nr:chaperonin 10-like protein [Paraphoma chrysanthemicola]
MSVTIQVEAVPIQVPSKQSKAALYTEHVNKSFVLSPSRQFSFESRPVPQLQTSRDVLVRVIATGLCGSDIHYWQHGRIGKYVVEGPIVLGHESAGIVEACGEDVKSLRVGDRVALEPGVGCNTCETCRSGRYNLCESMQFAATPPYDGTLSTFYCLPEENCFKLPPHISFREGALVEPLSIAVHCCRLAGNLQGRTVAVFGAGPIGLLCCAVARAFGAATVVVADVVDSRLEFATNFSASHTYKMLAKSPESNAQGLLGIANIADGADVVIDATGAEPCIECGVAALKRGGTFVQAGLGAPKISFPIGQICDKEATLKGSFRYGPGDYKLAIELLNSRRICLEDLITHEYRFEDAEKAFVNVAAKTGIKTIILGPGVDQIPDESAQQGQVARL